MFHSTSWGLVYTVYSHNFQTRATADGRRFDEGEMDGIRSATEQSRFSQLPRNVQHKQLALLFEAIWGVRRATGHTFLLAGQVVSLLTPPPPGPCRRRALLDPSI